MKVTKSKITHPKVTEDLFKGIKMLTDAKVANREIARLHQISTATVYRVSKCADFQAYRAMVEAEGQRGRTPAQPIKRTGGVKNLERLQAYSDMSKAMLDASQAMLEATQAIKDLTITLNAVVPTIHHSQPEPVKNGKAAPWGLFGK